MGKVLPLAAGAGGVAVAVSPFLSWYRADLPGRDLRFSGVEVAGELWTLPLLGAVALGAGLGLLVVRADPWTRAGRWCGGLVILAGLFALGWSLKAIGAPRAVAVTEVAGSPEVPLRATAIAWVTAAIAATLVAAGALWLRRDVPADP